ncbi:MAG: hypothetical protein EAZ84_09935 [Verrucomicrobia bacterium]|nr:MAG: hypothetical protein EAZ84_09935 [Verrucomicrobiota bacterium]
MSRVLLIDADILAYKATSANQKKYDWGDGVVSTSADFTTAKRTARDTINALMDDLKADEMIVCLSDDVNNFRKEIYPAYKTNRKGTERPQYLYDLKEWLADKYPTRITANLEADDVMGILATEPSVDERIMVSEDKDMMTVPGLLFRPNQPQLGVFRVSPLEATRFLFWQTIVGDQTDGYPGAKGVGKASPFALDVLEAEDEIEAWDEVLMAYQSAGLTEKDAVQQCNLARILKHGDMAGNRVIPWVPPYDPERGNYCPLSEEEAVSGLFSSL